MDREMQLIHHCLQAMMTTEQIRELLIEAGCNAKGTKTKLIDSVLNNTNQINIDYITKHLRAKWTPANLQIHFANMKSGKLEGHDWHGAMPSFLHLSLQDKVRECSAGEITIDELIGIGADIIKHEYFIVAQHDILETSIINHFPDTIPPISSKSITDFVFKGVPVDLKVSTFPTNWMERAKVSDPLNYAEQENLIIEMYSGADTERMRKQAEGSINNWGLNRMYIIIRDQNEWFSNPEVLVEKVLEKMENVAEPHKINVNGFEFEAFCIDV